MGYKAVSKSTRTNFMVHVVVFFPCIAIQKLFTFVFRLLCFCLCQIVFQASPKPKLFFIHALLCLWRKHEKYHTDYYRVSLLGNWRRRSWGHTSIFWRGSVHQKPKARRYPMHIRACARRCKCQCTRRHLFWRRCHSFAHRSTLFRYFRQPY